MSDNALKVRTNREIRSYARERLLGNMLIPCLVTFFFFSARNVFEVLMQLGILGTDIFAFFFYIDGVYTIIDMATSYGQALGLESSGLLLALLLTQLVAFPCAIIFGRLAQKYAAENLITVCILAYLGIAVFAIFLTNLVEFWILAVLVGMFQGGIQALSRSYFTKIIPPEQSGEFFGIYDICGKGAAFLGTTLVGLVSQLTGSINKGISVLSVLFLCGLFFFRVATSSRKKEA